MLGIELLWGEFANFKYDKKIISPEQIIFLCWMQRSGIKTPLTIFYLLNIF